MKNLPISDKALISMLKERLETRTLAVDNECPIYQEYLDECNALAKAIMKIIHADHGYLVDSLRSIAKACNKIEAPKGKKIKRIPIINNIMSEMHFVVQDKEYERIQQNINETRAGASKTVISLVNQAKGYLREAFTQETFDDAGTKLNDAADILELAQDIFKGDMQSAAKRDFDTIIREDISSKAWDWLQTHVRGNIL